MLIDKVTTMWDYNLDLMFAYTGLATLSIAKVRDDVQLVAAIVVIGYTLWKWYKDIKKDKNN